MDSDSSDASTINLDSSEEIPKAKRLKTLAFNVKCSDGNNLLHQFVLDNSDPDNLTDENYITPVLRLMSDTQNDANAFNNYGYTALHLAILRNNFPMVKSLLSCLINIDVNKRTDGIGDNTALHLAAQFGHLSIMQELLNNGANVNKKTRHSQQTALHYAVESGNLDVIKLLLDNDANVNKRDKCGRSPFHNAVESGNYVIIKLLLNNGALVNMDGDDRPPLCIAVMTDNFDTVELLLDIGANVNARVDDETTLLHKAVEVSCYSIVKLLLNNGAYVNARDDYEKTPLDKAVETNRFHIMILLLHNGAKCEKEQDKLDRYFINL